MLAIFQMLALSVLDCIILLDKFSQWLSFISSKGYLQHLVDSLSADDDQLLSVLAGGAVNIRILYLYESKMVGTCMQNRFVVCDSLYLILIQNKDLLNAYQNIYKKSKFISLSYFTVFLKLDNLKKISSRDGFIGLSFGLICLFKTFTDD